MRKNFALSELEKQDAREALAVLHGSDLTLTAAAKLALRLDDSAGAATATPIERAVDDFVRDGLRRKLRAATTRGYRDQLDAFAGDHEGLKLDDVTRAGLKAYLEGLPLARGSIELRYRCVRALYRWARRRTPPLCRTNPAHELALELPHVERAVRFLAPEQVEQVMRQIPARWRPAAALALFAGIRPQEVASKGGKPSVAWEDIDVSGRVIRVTEKVAKTRRARPLEGLPDAVWAWLEEVPARERKGAVCPGKYEGLREALKLAAGLGGGRGKWPQDATRHSFATYALAITNDPGKVSLWLGHEGKPSLLHTRYRGLTNRESAEKFFAIKPLVIGS